jgi:hypothetical protein
MVSNRAHVPAEIAKPGSGVNNGNTICIRERDLKARRVAAELLEARITNWHGTAATVKFELHTELYGGRGSRGKLWVTKQMGSNLNSLALIQSKRRDERWIARVLIQHARLS